MREPHPSPNRANLHPSRPRRRNKKHRTLSGVARHSNSFTRYCPAPAAAGCGFTFADSFSDSYLNADAICSVRSAKISAVLRFEGGDERVRFRVFFFEVVESGSLTGMKVLQRMIVKQ